MKTYIVTTGSLFGLLTVAHIWRVVVEPHVARDPWFILTTVLSAAMCVWGFRVFSSLSTSKA